ncbi:hypothetical protein C1H46_002960 [Malus baccata]|uniref:Uncharacterized protein n=1 Tax=Malus baccata TaxID=106549 RepID=A0A540NK28_MALBA|nr:hypothetical protein C1H46_002960 [Malus baccata]
MQGNNMMASSSGSSQGSSSNSNDVPSITGGIITRVPNNFVSSGMSYANPSQGSSFQST